MNWKAIFAPWSIIRELRKEVSFWQSRAHHFQEWALEIRTEEFHKAKDHFEQRTVALQAHNNALLNKLVEISAMTPAPAYVFPPDFTKGEQQ